MWGRNPPCYKIGTNPYSACPEFRQDEYFVSVLWRREVECATGQETGNETGYVSGNVKGIVLSIGGGTLTRFEIVCFAQKRTINNL